MPVDWICFEVKLSADLCNQTLLCEIILKIQDDKIVTLRVKLVRAQRRFKISNFEKNWHSENLPFWKGEIVKKCFENDKFVSSDKLVIWFGLLIVTKATLKWGRYLNSPQFNLRLVGLLLIFGLHKLLFCCPFVLILLQFFDKHYFQHFWSTNTNDAHW